MFGAGTVQWAWGLDSTNAWDTTTDPERRHPAGSEHAAGDREPLCGHGNPANDADQRSFARKRVDRHQSAHLHDHFSGAECEFAERQQDHGLGDCDRFGRRCRFRSRGLDRRRLQLASGNYHRRRRCESINWTYNWVAEGYPTATIETRAVDDSANLETPSDARTVNVSCPCSIWGTSVTPPTPDDGDTVGIEVGVKFQSSTYGSITGLRFYKSTANTGTHVGSLWSASGQLLARATFSE